MREQFAQLASFARVSSSPDLIARLRARYVVVAGAVIKYTHQRGIFTFVRGVSIFYIEFWNSCRIIILIFAYLLYIKVKAWICIKDNYRFEEFILRSVFFFFFSSVKYLFAKQYGGNSIFNVKIKTVVKFFLKRDFFFNTVPIHLHFAYISVEFISFLYFF